jgi:hypothetical protein
MICEVQIGKTEARLEAELADLDYQYYLIADDGLVLQTTIQGHPQFSNFLLVPSEKTSFLAALLVDKRIHP